MSSLLNKSDEVQTSASLALLPNKQKLEKQNEYTNVPVLTPLQQRKRDALELAELIYKIYNETCPVTPNITSTKGNENG